MKKKTYGLRVGVRMSIRYHDRRRSWFAGWHAVTLVSTVIFAGGVSAWLREWEYSWVLAVLMGVSVATNLVFRFADRAADHHALANRFRELDSKLRRSDSTITAERLQDLADEREAIQSEELVSPKRLLSVLCQYELIRATRDDLSDDVTRMMSRIWWWRRALAPIWSQQGFVTKNLRGIRPKDESVKVQAPA